MPVPALIQHLVRPVVSPLVSLLSRWLAPLAVLVCAACGSQGAPSASLNAGSNAGGAATAGADSGGVQNAVGMAGAASGAGAAPMMTGPVGGAAGASDRGGASGSGGGGTSPLEQSPLIVDTHTHFWDLARNPGFSNGKNELPADYAAIAKPAGVSGTILIEAVWQSLEDNLWGLELTRGDSVVVGVIGKLKVGSANFSKDLVTLAANPRFRGLRVGPSDLASADMAQLAERNLVAEVDLTGSTQALELVRQNALAMPQLKIVIEHAGGLSFAGAPAGALADALAAAAKAPNVYCKVSRFQEQSGSRPAPTDAAAYAKTLDFLLNTFGEDRLLFGSNWPLSEDAGSLESAVGVMHSYWQGKDPEAARKFFSGNANALYAIPIR